MRNSTIPTDIQQTVKHIRFFLSKSLVAFVLNFTLIWSLKKIYAYNEEILCYVKKKGGIVEDQD